MEISDTKVKTSMRNFLLALALLLITNILMGVTLMSMSKHTLREQIEGRMLDVSKAAAAQIDGDIIKHISAADSETEEYIRLLDILRSFQDNIELDYIYGINPGPDNTFTFAIDPDREQPADFGEPIEATNALITASQGTPSVDQTPHSDEWGRFYTAYSPIFDSAGNVSGIIGVDFNADWYEDTLNSHKAAAIILTMVAMTIGIILAFTIMSQNRKRFKAMLKNLSALHNETKKLDDIIMQSSIKRLDMLPESESAVLKELAAGEAQKSQTVYEYEALSSSIDNVYSKLKHYLKYVDSQVNTDETTGVRNKVAYKSRIKELDELIPSGDADFSVAFFDINGLKKIYTHYGFEAGDKLLFECAQLLKSVFGKNNVYHVTGDEFIVIAANKSRFDMQDLFAEFEKGLKKYNDEHVQENNLSVAKGAATYAPEKYHSYREVFIDAKKACDNDKDDFHRKNTLTD